MVSKKLQAELGEILLNVSGEMVEAVATWRKAKKDHDDLQEQRQAVKESNSALRAATAKVLDVLPSSTGERVE